MASAVTELLSWVTSIIGPAAGDPRTAASVRTPLGQLASRTKWLKEMVADKLVGSAVTIGAVDATTDVITAEAHGFSANNAVQAFVGTGGSLPGGISASTAYYVDVLTADTFKLSATSGPGSAVDLTAGFGGAVYVSKIPDVLGALLTSSGSGLVGSLLSLMVTTGGTQAITGAKTVSDLTLAGTSTLKVASRTITRSVPLLFVDASNNSYRLPAILTTSINGAAVVHLPHGQTVTTVTATITPETVGSLPGTMPVFKLSRIDSAGNIVDLGSKTDDSATAGAFSAAHDISITGLAVVVDNETYTYRVSLSAASDAAYTTVNRVRITATVTGSRDWT